jgi:hypothetical protein
VAAVAIAGTAGVLAVWLYGPEDRRAALASRTASAGGPPPVAGAWGDTQAAPAIPTQPPAPSLPPRPIPGTPLFAPMSFEDESNREQSVQALREFAQQRQLKAASFAAKSNMAIEGEEDGRAFRLVDIVDGRVYRYATRNANAAISTATAAIRQTPPYGVSGSGVTVGVWDAGTVRNTHREFDNRVTLRDAASMHYHSTHVAGTIAAAGVDPAAKGMAPAARIDSFNWNDDLTQMAQFAMAAPGQTEKIQVSNHSYGFQAGWESGTWYGNWDTPQEADGFGLYDTYASMWDTVCYNAPYYLPFVAAGNDRSDSASATGTSFTYYDGLAWLTKPYDPTTDPPRDGWDQGGYDTISYIGNAKNILTVGAVNDAVTSGTRDLSRAIMTAFSGWGPSDDGRVKPDLVANGTSLFSTYTSSDTSYGTLSGTSMAAPNAAGSAALLIELHARLFSNQVMLASTLKALLVHTADDLGRSGPDYQFGWGMLNAKAAADHLLARQRLPDAHRMVEDGLTAASAEKRYAVIWDNASPLRATLCWTDYPGTARNTLDDRTPVLVHDLDLRIVSPDGQTNFPFALDPAAPTAAAERRDNVVDTVEQVMIEAPSAPGVYEVVVRMKGAPAAPRQDFSLLVSGSTLPPAIEHEPLQNTIDSIGDRPVNATIRSESVLDAERLLLIWNAGGGWITNTLSPTGGSLFTASIPAQPLGTPVRYRLEAASVNGMSSRLPAEGDYGYLVTTPLALTVQGAPMDLATCEPAYGMHWIASGTVVRASAAPHTDSMGGFRYNNAGWTGTGSVPATGSTYEVAFALESDSSLTWQWAPVFQLRQTASLAGVLNLTNWWPIGAAAETVAVPEVVTNFIVRRFYGWYVDGARWPDAQSESVNPARGIVMHVPRAAEARYMTHNTDADADGLPDWWELRYFGSSTIAPNEDSDGDGFTNLKEYQDGTHPRNNDSFPAAPSIAHVPLPTVVTSPAPWSVAARVTDNCVVQSAGVRWWRNGGPQQNASLALAGAATGDYTGAIPAPGATGDRFVYEIRAADAAQMAAVNGPYTFDVAYPVAVTAPDAFALQSLISTQTTNLFLSVSNAGHRALSWTADIQRAGLADDVERGEGDWLHEGRNDVWHISPLRSFSASNAWHFGSETTGHYPDNANAALISGPVVVPEAGRLSFRQWLHTEAPLNATQAWDGCFVEVSTNNGASFTSLTPVGGYPYVIYGHSASPFPDGTPCFAGTGGWERIEFDLAAFAGQMVMFGFRFGSDGYVSGAGWHVDDIVVGPISADDGWLVLGRASGSLEPGATDILAITLSAQFIEPAETRSAGVRFLSNDPTRPSRVIPVSLHNLTRAIRVEQPPHGSIAPAGTRYLAAGDDAAFEIAADPYYRIAAVVTDGAAAPVQPATNRLVVTFLNVLSNMVLRADLRADLAAHDVPLWWLASFALTNSPPDQEAGADQDEDGAPAWAEYVAGTDPTDPSSLFAIRHIAPFATHTVETEIEDEGVVYTSAWSIVDGMTLSWPSASNRVYHLFGADPRTGLFKPLQTNVPATPPENTLLHRFAPETPVFYRIGVELE